MIAHIRQLGLLIFISVGCKSQSLTSENYIRDSLPLGKWVIQKYITTDNPSGLSSVEAKKIIGQFVVINIKHISVREDKCNDPKYVIDTAGDSYFRSNNVSRKELGLDSNEIKRLNVECISETSSNVDSPNFNYDILIISKNRMIINILGVYFVLKKV